MKQMIYSNTFSTFWCRTFLCLFLVCMFQQAFGAESCGQLGPESNYTKLNEILKCLEDRIDKNSSAKGNVSKSNSIEPKKPTANTSNEKLPVFRATGSSVVNASSAQNVRDGHTNIGWQAKSNGAWVELQLDYPCFVEEIAYYFVPKKHAQIRQATIKFDNNSSQSVKFEHSEKEGWQPRPLIPTKAEKVRIIVDDIFPEVRSDTIWIAEIELHGSQCEK